MHITQKWWRWALGMAALVLLFVCLIINPLWLWQTQAADGDFQSNVESIYYSPMITDTIVAFFFIIFASENFDLLG